MERSKAGAPSQDTYSWAQFFNVFRVASLLHDEPALAWLAAHVDTFPATGKRFETVNRVARLLRLRDHGPVPPNLSFTQLPGADESAMLCHACQTFKALADYRPEDLEPHGQPHHCRHDGPETVVYTIRCRTCGGGFGWRSV